MGIKVEFNPDLALRNISEYHKRVIEKSKSASQKILKLGRFIHF